MSRPGAAVAEVTGASCCRHPVRLVASGLDRATGELLERRALVACKDRRELLCPACAATYQGDAFQLASVGLQGGKGVPAAVAGHPACFLTLTAPSFGPVHSGEGTPGRRTLCHPRRRPERCPHGVLLACLSRHPAGDPDLGQPLCPECFDYEGAVLWNLGVSGLWTRTAVAIAREAAGIGGVSVRAIKESFRLAYLKVVEFQRRGLVHLHVVVRADGPDGPGSPPPAWLTVHVVVEAASRAATRIQVPGPGGSQSWGPEREVRALGTHDREVVAAYVAKYAVKASGDDPVLARRLTEGELATLARSNPHLGRLAATSWRLGARPDLATFGLRRHAHTFGFRGHFATKSTRYSTTFGALRRARAEHRQGLEEKPSEEWTIADTSWRFAGRGYDSAEAVQLAEALAEGIRTRPRRSPAASPDVPRTVEQGR